MPNASPRYLVPTVLALGLAGCETIFGSDSPPPQEIIYSECTTTCVLRAIRPDGTSPRLVADSAYGGEWSPDGSKIAFVREHAGQWDLFVMRSDGSDLRQLTNDTAEEDVPTWSPDGRTLAYTVDFWWVDRINADGTGYQRVTTSRDMSVYTPDWSPDGGTILFEEGGQVATVSATGGPIRVLTEGEWPTYSTDGSRIVFSLISDGGRRIATANADGTNVQFLIIERPAERVDDFGARWSRDGKSVVFTRYKAGPLGSPRADIYLLDADGVTRQLVTGPAWQAEASWLR